MGYSAEQVFPQGTVRRCSFEIRLYGGRDLPGEIAQCRCQRLQSRLHITFGLGSRFFGLIGQLIEQLLKPLWFGRAGLQLVMKLSKGFHDILGQVITFYGRKPVRNQ